MISSVLPVISWELWNIDHSPKLICFRVVNRKYRLLNVKNVERKGDTKRGKRYLIELELMDTTAAKAVTLSEYVFQTKDQDNLCYPKDFQWNRTSQVYLVVTSKNQGRWLYHFIKNVEEILSETGDSNLHVVIFDYESWDIDVESVLQESSITLYRVIKQHGRYSRTEAFTEAINSIPDPHAIVFMLDLHLDIHSAFIEDIRKVKLCSGCVCFWRKSLSSSEFKYGRHRAKDW